jgi:hypothetical protein
VYNGGLQSSVTGLHVPRVQSSWMRLLRMYKFVIADFHCSCHVLQL